MSDSQLGLFDPRPGIVGRHHPDTSAAAAERVAPRTGTQRRRVLDFIAAREDGATDLEIQRALHLEGSSERPRRIELVAAGFITDTGRRRDDCIVWAAL